MQAHNIFGLGHDVNALIRDGSASVGYRGVYSDSGANFCNYKL